MGLSVNALKERWRGWREARFLETHGCKTWREYERSYDQDVGYLARRAHTYYHGYSYIFPLESPLAGRGNKSYHETVDQMIEWCEQNCQGKWRNDWHRGFWDQQGNYELNSIGGGDIMFFAFKEESDYMWFTLVFG